MFTPEQLQQLSSGQSEQDFEFDIPRGDDKEELWQDMINLRPQVDGRYIFSKFRGGSTQITSISGETIYSTFSFSTDLAEDTKQYYVFLTESGNVYLYENGAGSPEEIMDGFSGDTPVEFINNGRFLYAFEHGGDVQKYYDIVTESSYDFNSHQVSKILSTSFIEGDFTRDNVWGIEKGNTVIVLPVAPKSLSDFVSEENIDFTPFITRVEQVHQEYCTYKNEDRFTDTQQAGTGESRDKILPYNSDLENLVGRSGRYELSNGIFTGNVEAVPTPVYRAYVVVDILNDGTATIPGRPVIVRTDEYSLTDDQIIGVSLSVNEASANVEKRFLCSTRWQYTQKRALEPSNDRYSNSAFFINSEINRGAHDYSDFTSDQGLIRPISEVLPLRSGIPLLFGPGEVTAHTVGSFKGSLISGNYDIQRPVPMPYTSNSGDGNSYINIESGNDLTDDPEISIAFEYSNGKKSDIYDSGAVLTDAEETVIIDTEKKAILTVSADTVEWGRAMQYVDIQVTIDDIDALNTIRLFAYEGRQELAEYIGDAITETTDLDLVWDVEVNNTSVYLTHKSGGTSGNGKKFSATIVDRQPVYDPDDEQADVEDYEFNIDVSSERSTGGGSVVEDTISANKMQLHSLNLLVAKVFVLIKSGSSYRLFREVKPTESYFAGAELRLPNNDTDIDNLGSFTDYTTDPEVIEEKVKVSSGLLLSIPYQQFQIDRQYRIDTNNSIQKLLPLQFDADKTVLRYKILVITNNDIQAGYLTGSGDTFDSEFETIHESIEVINPEFAQKTGGVVFLQTQKGLHRFTPREGLGLLIDRDRYNVLSGNLRDVTYHDRHGEYWFAFGGTEVIVLKPDEGSVYRMKYPQDVQGVQFSFGKMSVTTEGRLLETDRESVFTDTIGATSHDITAELVSRVLSNELTQLRMFEFTVIGKDADAELFLDNQITRYEDEDSSGWEKVFDASFNYSEQEVVISGASWEINERAIMPRFKLQAVPKSVSAFISKAVLKGYITSNKNVARK